MRIGMIGLGRMGADMSRRLLRAGHDVVAHDIDPEAVERLATDGATGAGSPGDLVEDLEPPRSIWMMLPAAVVAGSLSELADHLGDDDTVIDGGNSHWRDDVDRAAMLAERGVHYVDVGVSGGVWGLERGYCLMIGGEQRAVARLEPILGALAPGVHAAPRTPGRDGDVSAAEQGWLHCGPSGAGHFVKMVHNGIEYGVMAAYAEGMAILDAANPEERLGDAETAPLRQPRYYAYDIDTAEVAEVWRRGSVIGSWLLDLTAATLHADPGLEHYAGHVSDSGEGRWTVQAAIDVGVPANVISSALYSRFASRGNADFGNRALSAMRAAFGGHGEVDPDS
jgi:6-phosphogluconate dehydrogenase